MKEHNRPTVLVVEHDQQNLQVITEMIEQGGYKCLLAESIEQILKIIKEEKPDLILLGDVLSETNGYEVCRLIRANNITEDLSIIFLTPKIKAEDIIDVFEAGGIDYISKPFNLSELKIRMKTYLDLKKSKDELKKVYIDLKKINLELKEKNDLIIIKNKKINDMNTSLRNITIIDPLTSIYNKRYITTRLNEEKDRKKRYNTDFSILMLDIDKFKNVNDTFGHDGGDHVLVMLAKLISNTIRKVDVLARWGGEEFLVLLAETKLESASIAAELIRKRIEEEEIMYNKQSIRITATIGVSEAAYGENIDSFIIRADNALYKGKADGRNRVVASKVEE